jgi:hypothetical protein
MHSYGLPEAEIRRRLERELGKTAASTSFYWESEELEEVLDLVVDAVARVIAANNAKLADDWARHGAQDLRITGV